jgi:hypothetical protein
MEKYKLMKRYSIIHVPALSFFSKALYRDVCFHWKGAGFSYLLLLLAVCWIAPILKMQVALTHFVDKVAPKIVSQVPTISIVNGKASIKEPQPYSIVDPETGKTLVVIDTTGAISSVEGMEAIGLVTATQAIFKKSKIETRSFSFGDIEEFTLDKDKIRSWLSAAEKFTAAVLYPLAVFGSFIARIIQLLIYAAIGLLFASWCKSKRTYGELLRLSVVAVTPCIIVKTILGVGGIQIPFAGLWYFLGAMGFLFFGIKAASQEESPTMDSTAPSEGAPSNV